MASLSGSKRKATAAASDSSPEAAGGAGDRPALRRRVDEAGATAGASRYAEFSDEDDESRAVPDEPSDDDMDDEEFNEKLVETPVPSDARMPLIVRRIKMQNVRCHKHLELEFGPSVNFITGKNGSGKSSILLALRLALGQNLSNSAKQADGSTVSQADNIIRKASDGEAYVQVDFSNEGTPGNLPRDRFGKFFTVKRTMSRRPDGKVTDTYLVLKDGASKVDISKKEMVLLLQENNMFPDNPVMIMDQETGKSLFGGTAATQYKFFMQATNLQRTFDHIISSKESAVGMQELLADKIQSVEGLKHRKEQAKRAVDSVNQLVTLQATVAALEADVLWAKLAEEDRDIEEKLAVVAAKFDDEKISKMETVQLQACANMVLAKEIAEKKLQDRAGAYDAVTSQVTAKARELEAATLPLKRARVEQANAKGRMDKARRDVAAAERKVAAFEEELAAKDVQSERQQRLGRVKKAKQALAEAEPRLIAASAALEQSEALLEERQAAAASAASDRDGAASDAQAAKAALDALLKTAGAKASDPLTQLKERAVSSRGTPAAQAFDAHNAIQRALARGAVFSTPPVGPLFTKVKCEQPWIKALESIWPARLQYMVSTPADAAVLEGVLGKSGRYTRKARSTVKYDSLRPIPGAATLQSVLTIEDPWVFNQVADDLHFDRVVLARTREEASALAAKFKPQSCLMPDGARELYTATGSTLRAPEWVDPCVSSLVQPVGGVDTKAREAELRDDLKRATRENEEVMAAFRQASAMLAEAQQAVRKATVARDNAERDIKQAKSNLARAEAEPEPVDTNEEDTVKQAELSEACESAKAQLMVEEEAYRAAGDRVAALQPAVSAAEGELKELQQQLNNLSNEEAEEEVRRAQAAVDQGQRKLDFLRGKLMEMKATKTAQLAELATARAEWEAKRSEVARTTGMREARREAKSSSKEAAAKLKATREHYERESKRVSKSKAEIAAIMAEKEAVDAAYSATMSSIQAVETNYGMLKEEIKAYQRKFRSTKDLVTANVSKQFKHLMAERGHGAKLTIAHKGSDGSYEHGQLDVFVQPDKETRFSKGLRGSQAATQGDMADNGAYQHVSTLSGGEKSSSTLTLLTAISQVSPVPFRLMDEFDVFQDEATRKASVQTLLTAAAKRNPDGRTPQFILFTPHDVSAALKPTKEHPDPRATIKVLHLKAPERGTE